MNQPHTDTFNDADGPLTGNDIAGNDLDLHPAALDAALDTDTDAVTGAYDEVSEEDDTFALWNGDQGTLEAHQRDTLVALLKKSFISSDDTIAWRTLTRDPGPIITSLNNLYFVLVLDERAEVAYATPARNADQPFKTLVRDTTNSREETLLLIYLRERHRAETSSGQHIVHVDTQAMLDYIARFRPLDETDLSGNTKRVLSAIAGLLSAGLLVKTPDPDRYRIHRAIEALLPLTTLQQLLAAFTEHAPERCADSDTTHDADTGAAAAVEPAAPTDAPTATGPTATFPADTELPGDEHPLDGDPT